MTGTRRRSGFGVSLGFLGTLLATTAARGQLPSPPALEAPLRSAESGDSRAVPIESTPQFHEALRPEGQPAPTVRAPNAPPIPVEERQSDDRADARSQWVAGYWSWDDALSKFLWVSGAWAVPPTGRFWVDGTWRRDENGWYRVRGFWSSRKTSTNSANSLPAVANSSATWRKTGPPPPIREEPGPAPAPNTFYVPGHHEPAANGNELTWVPGFWSQAQRGWDWVPARWVRLANGWDYRPGQWSKDHQPGSVPLGEDESRRHTVARPRADQGNPADALPPAIVDSERARQEVDPSPEREQGTSLPNPDGEPLTGLFPKSTLGLPGVRVYVTPGRGYPSPLGYPIGPGVGPYPFGYPDGRIVPRGAVLPYVPPFVRGLLDRVMP